jgi:hypothetical protein
MVGLLRWVGGGLIWAGVICGVLVGTTGNRQAFWSLLGAADYIGNMYSAVGLSIFFSGAVSGIAFLGLARAVEVGEGARAEIRQLVRLVEDDRRRSLGTGT